MARITESLAVFLKQLSDHLRKDDVRDLIFLCDIPDGEAEKIRDGSGVFKWLMKQGKLKESNLSDIVELLNCIHRNDLGKKVKTYMDQLEDNKPRPPVPTIQSRDPESTPSLSKEELVIDDDIDKYGGGDDDDDDDDDDKFCQAQLSNESTGSKEETA